MIAMLARCERLADAAARAAAARADLVRAEAAAAAEAEARQARIEGRLTSSIASPAPAPAPPPEPLSAETATLRDLHNLLAALPDSRGWEGPAPFDEDDDDGLAAPVLPMPAVMLHPVSAGHASAARRTRLADPVVVAERAAVRAAKAAARAADCARMDAIIAEVDADAFIKRQYPYNPGGPKDGKWPDQRTANALKHRYP
jgi:hypothetical protein